MVVSAAEPSPQARRFQRREHDLHQIEPQSPCRRSPIEESIRYIRIAHVSGQSDQPAEVNEARPAGDTERPRAGAVNVGNLVCPESAVASVTPDLLGRRPATMNAPWSSR